MLRRKIPANLFTILIVPLEITKRDRHLFKIARKGTGPILIVIG